MATDMVTADMGLGGGMATANPRTATTAIPPTATALMVMAIGATAMATAAATGNGRISRLPSLTQGSRGRRRGFWRPRVRRWKPGGRMPCSIGNCAPAEPALLVNPVGPSIDGPTKTTAGTDDRSQAMRHLPTDSHFRLAIAALQDSDGY